MVTTGTITVTTPTHVELFVVGDGSGRRLPPIDPTNPERTWEPPNLMAALKQAIHNQRKTS